MSNESSSGSTLFLGINIVISTITAIIGHQMHGSVGWAIVNFIFSWTSWIKWLICKDITMSIIKEAFGFFFQ